MPGRAVIILFPINLQNIFLIVIQNADSVVAEMQFIGCDMFLAEKLLKTFGTAENIHHFFIVDPVERVGLVFCIARLAFDKNDRVSFC